MGEGPSKEQLKKRYYGLVVQQLQKGATPENILPRLLRAGFSQEEAQEMINSAIGEAGGAVQPAPSFQGAPPPPPVAGGSPPPAPPQVREINESALYAGFWAKLVAALIDAFIICLISLPPVILISMLTMFGNVTHGNTGAPPAPPSSAIVFIYLIFFGVYLVYYALMEGGSKHSTLGKRVFGLVVVTGSGDEVTIARAGLRCIISFISGAIFDLGYLIALFTPKKQTLHDLITDTIVIKVT